MRASGLRHDNNKWAWHRWNTDGLFVVAMIFTVYIYNIMVCIICVFFFLKRLLLARSLACLLAQQTLKSIEWLEYTGHHVCVVCVYVLDTPAPYPREHSAFYTVYTPPTINEH